ncbi:MAG: DUF4167 domain-containing protein [Pseudomonadota bacterium]|nr:DUF4167 domain-containing protein [Pseudomonadota bacterium]MEC8724984.1 DUF4167 domain-containing protein [Pseudomonadota bacterium]|tara:strand:- start:347 stop:802 length:456 start_codon:yes stop_codon:yes gene_type:complete
MRGRGHGRKSGNSRNQSFESNGPDVKVRGNAQQVVEKYLTLARDASSAGDRINAESYYQFAEHYYRVMTAANELQRQQQQKHSETDNENSSDGEISAKVEAAENDGSSQNSRRRRNGRGNGAAKDAAQKPAEDEASSEAVVEEDAGESANV